VTVAGGSAFGFLGAVFSATFTGSVAGRCCALGGGSYCTGDVAGNARGNSGGVGVAAPVFATTTPDTGGMIECLDASAAGHSTASAPAPITAPIVALIMRGAAPNPRWGASRAEPIDLSSPTRSPPFLSFQRPSLSAVRQIIPALRHVDQPLLGVGGSGEFGGAQALRGMPSVFFRFCHDECLSGK
jgi:hypothetical protein